jgi:transposase, IS30 family
MLRLIRKVGHKSADKVASAILHLLKPLTHPLHTMTSDNGKEFAQHETIADRLKARFYFAHPYSSWERGTNENTNGLIRQFFPKKMTLSTVSEQALQLAVDRLNNRPRKTLPLWLPMSSTSA